MAWARIGCAGWSIPKAMDDAFPGSGSHLQRYAGVLNAAEINSSFYRPHQPQTYARWAASVPDGFRFAVKAPKHMTHELRLQDCAVAMRQFAAQTAGLQEKLGCVLVQLPPSLQFDAAAAAGFFALAREHFACMIACEARHPGWFGDDATALLCSAAVTRVIADPPKGQPGPHLPTTAATYARLHGHPRMYYSSYEADFLDQAATSLAGRVGDGNDAWCIFDNTASGAAAANAVALLQRLS